MREVYDAAVNSINGERSVDLEWLCQLAHGAQATRERAQPEIRGPDILPRILSAQLQTCIAALEAKQADAILGVYVLSSMGKSQTDFLPVDA